MKGEALPSAKFLNASEASNVSANFFNASEANYTRSQNFTVDSDHSELYSQPKILKRAVFMYTVFRVRRITFFSSESS